MNKIIVLSLILLLGGCGLFGGTKPVPPVKVEKRVQPIPVFHPPLPEGVTWQQVEWTVLTPETMAQYIEDLQNGEAPPMAFYALTPEGYRALSENVADIQRFINQSNALLIYYRENLVEIVVEQVETTEPTED